MKYRLKKDLPFMKQDTIFRIGCWTTGGFGIDLGNNSHGSHNGVRTFEKYENELLRSIKDNTEWIEKIPQSKYELLSLYDNKQITRDEFLAKIEY